MNQLLNEVRHDALKKARGIRFGEQLYALVEYMDTLNWIARKEGLLSLEEEMNKIPASLKLNKEIQWIAHFVYDGCDPEDFIEVATTRYWMNDFQGEDAFMYYIILYAFLKLQSTNYGRLDWLLIEFLPYETREAYEAFKKNAHAPLAADQKASMRKNLFEDEPVSDQLCEEGKQFTAKVQAADRKTILAFLSKVDNTDLLAAMRGMDTHTRHKLLLYFSDRLIEMFAEDWLLFEFVTDDFLKDAFKNTLEVFKEAERGY